MRTFIVVLIGFIIFLGYQVYTQMNETPLAEEDLKQVLQTESYQTRHLKSSFERLLPKVQGGWMRQLESSPTLVMLDHSESVPMDPTDAVDQVDQMLTNRPEEAISFLRWCMFISDFSASDKELIFEKALTKLSPHEVKHISKDLMNRQVEPVLYERALGLYTAGMAAPQVKQFLQEQWPKTTEPTLQAVLSNFADNQGMSIR